MSKAVPVLFLIKSNPQLNDRNFSRQHIAILLDAACCACLAPPVAWYCDMLGVVGSNLKMVKFFMYHVYACCTMLYFFGQVSASMLCLGMRTSLIFNTRNLATRHNWVAKRAQHVAPNNGNCFNNTHNLNICDGDPTELLTVASNCNCNCMKAMMIYGRAFGAP